jgi:hypothetical protein
MIGDHQRAANAAMGQRHAPAHRAPITLPQGAFGDLTNHGTRLAVGSGGDVAAYIFPVDPASWEVTACRIAGRHLTQAEWRHYPPGRPYQATCPNWPVGS